MKGKKGEKINTIQNNLLECIEEIVGLAKEHKLGKTFFESAESYLKPLAQVLRISETQAALFSLILEYSDDDAVSIGEIAKAMKCGKMQILKYIEDFEELEKKRLIRAKHYCSSFYSRGRMTCG